MSLRVKGIEFLLLTSCAFVLTRCLIIEEQNRGPVSWSIVQRSLYVKVVYSR